MQQELGYLSEEAVSEIARFLNLPENEVFGVASFSAQFRLLALDTINIIAAIGQQPEIPARFKLKLSRANTIQVDSATLATNIEGVYAGGDVVSAPASVIEAIAAGRKAASSIDKYLGGDGIIDEELVPMACCNCFAFSPSINYNTALFRRALRH